VLPWSVGQGRIKLLPYYFQQVFWRFQAGNTNGHVVRGGIHLCAKEKYLCPRVDFSQQHQPMRGCAAGQIAIEQDHPWAAFFNQGQQLIPMGGRPYLCVAETRAQQESKRCLGDGAGVGEKNRVHIQIIAPEKQKLPRHQGS
jgi:hypothetical protein